MSVLPINVIRCNPCCRIINNKKESYYIINNKPMCTECMNKALDKKNEK